jgi:hypothetical protein
LRAAPWGVRIDECRRSAARNRQYAAKFCLA